MPNGSWRSLSARAGRSALLEQDVSEDELGLTRLREVARRRIPRPVTWWWTYRVRLAVPLGPPNGPPGRSPGK